MGVASYWRGNQVISRGLGFNDAISDRQRRAANVKPRPDDWGDKALTKALDLTRKHFDYSAKVAASRGQAFDAVAWLDWFEGYLWSELRVSKATAKRAIKIVKDAYTAQAVRQNPASYRSTAPAAKSFNARDRHPYWALSRWVSSDMRDTASEQTLAKAIGQSRVNAARAGILSEMDLEEVVYRKYGSPAPLSNPYTWQQEESRKAVLKALQTRDPEDVKKARALQARNERMALGQRSNPLGSRIAVPVGSGLIIGDQLVNPRRKRRPGAPARKPFQAQAFLFDRQHWTEARARQWLKKNGHKIGEVSLTDEYIKFKHWSPYDYQKGTLHDVLVAENVVATVGIPKSNSDAIDAPGYNKRGPRRQARLFTRGASDDYVFAGDPDDILW